MAQFRDATPITLPAPTGGINLRTALYAMPANQSPWLVNVDCEPEKVRARNGWVQHCEIGSVTPDIYSLGVFGARGSTNYKLFAYVADGSGTHKIYDVTTSTESLSHTLIDDTSGNAYPFNFAKRLAFTVETDWADCSAQYDGSAWAAWGFTYDDGGGADPIGSVVNATFKGRVYIFTGTQMYYAENVDVVTGATILEDLQYVFNEAGEILWATPISSPGDRSEELFLAIGSSSGEILVYGGDYPGSATWGLVGRFKTSPGVGYNKVLQYQNDVWVLTRTGIVSLRALFSQGDIAGQYLSLTTNIDRYWTKLLDSIDPDIAVFDIISIEYWPERNQIHILMPEHTDKDGVTQNHAMLIVYNTISQAWFFQTLAGTSYNETGGLTYFDGNLYFFSANIVYKNSLTGYKDQDYSTAAYSAISGEIQGAHSSFGSEATTKRAVGFQPIMKTDFPGANVTLKAVADFGQNVSGGASVELVDGYNHATYSVGAEGTYIQYRMEFTSDTASTDGLELFANAAILKQGGRG